MNGERIVCARCWRAFPDSDEQLEYRVAAHDCAAVGYRPRNWPGRVATGFLGAVCGLALAVGLVVAQGGYSAHVVLSGSMAPALQPGDLVLTRPVPLAALHVGDVLAYQIGDVQRVHRIVAIDGRTVQTRGDSNPSADPAVVLTGSTAYILAFRIPLIGWLWAVRGWLWLVLGAAVAVLAARMGWEAVKER